MDVGLARETCVWSNIVEGSGRPQIYIVRPLFWQKEANRVGPGVFLKM